MEITNVTEYEAIAKEKLPKMVYDYYASGAEDQWTLQENRNAFARILFRPRILIDVSKIDMTTTVLGFKISMPIMVAPTAMQKMAHPEGEYATARAASAAGTIMTLSSWATSSVEEVASTGPGIRFFQLYVYKNRKVVEQLVRRAEKAGFKAIALTVDTPRLGRRETDIKNRFTLPPNLTLKNFEGLDLGKMDEANDSGLASYVAGQIDRTLSWKDVQWLQTITSMPILVKGVLTGEDARIAIQAGAAGIIVSNHGARQLDYVPATISALEEVVKATQGRVPVFLDGGVRRGTDVFKALALGASGIFIGRPVVFSLAAEGEAGVRKVLQMLRDEFELTMALSGCRSLSEITRNHIITEWETPRHLPNLEKWRLQTLPTIAKEKLPKMVYDYYASGAEDQWTLQENRNAFARILFRPRILIDVSKIDMTTTILGFKISMPIMVAPTAMQKMAHPEGEYATARAASAAGTIMTLSSWATSSVEEVASTGPGIRFFQLYVYKNRKVVEQLVRRAERAGFKAIALTVDTPRLGRRESDIKNRFTLPPNLTLKNFEGLDLGKMDEANDSGLASYVAGQIDRTLSWKDVQWLQTITSMPILVKGVITGEDARIAIQAGAAGIIVSNHGARQLDYVPATISALEEVVKATQGRIPVFLDGGVRRGTDVFKALALGASGIFIGRPVVFSLAAEGEAGVRKVLQMLRDEFELTMALSGCRSLKEITRNHITTEWDTPRPSARTARCQIHRASRPESDCTPASPSAQTANQNQ
ncbi:LOW QUALITY PROTEIN: hypothetical protein HID58_003341 [Brassica napus]|uniref:(S)-2-hydroxy-acid oxidase n=1 Tax=Brassica napus TaxID=3708 RepID=A0ABQ8EQ73_BRANA|nr:LOW QUALITY PROTEIN: hypothetical protein HID58_003341 [Brassica napus]